MYVCISTGHRLGAEFEEEEQNYRTAMETLLAPLPGETAMLAPLPGEAAMLAPLPGEAAMLAPLPGETAMVAPLPGEAAMLVWYTTHHCSTDTQFSLFHETHTALD